MFKKVFIVAVIVIVGFHYLRKIPSQITGQESFTNSKYAYSFKYPKSWAFEKLGDHYVIVRRTNPDPDHAGKNRSLTSVTFEQIENPDHLSPRDLFFKNYAEDDKWLAKAGAPRKTIEDVTFAGQKALKIMTPGLQNCQYFFDKGDGVILSVALEIFGDETDSIFLDEAKKIVGSFSLN